MRMKRETKRLEREVYRKGPLKGAPFRKAFKNSAQEHDVIVRVTLITGLLCFTSLRGISLVDYMKFD